MDKDLALGQKIVLVGIGGAIGTVMRYSLYQWLVLESIWVTLFCNIMGAFCLAILYSYIALQVKSLRLEKLKLLLGVGLLGGFTTFSTISLESHHLLFAIEHNVLMFSIYILLTFIGGFFSSLAGHQLSLKLAKRRG